MNYDNYMYILYKLFQFTAKTTTFNFCPNSVKQYLIKDTSYSVSIKRDCILPYTGIHGICRYFFFKIETTNNQLIKYLFLHVQIKRKKIAISN